MQPLGVGSCGDQQSRGGDHPVSLSRDHRRRGTADEDSQFVLKLGNLDGGVLVPACQSPQRVTGRRGHRAGGRSRADGGQGLDQAALVQHFPAGPDRLGRGDHHGLDLADHYDTGLDRAAPHGQQHTDLLDDSLAGLGQRESFRFDQCLRSGGVGIDRVGFPVPAVGPSGSDDLADLDPWAMRYRVRPAP